MIALIINPLENIEVELRYICGRDYKRLQCL